MGRKAAPQHVLCRQGDRHPVRTRIERVACSFVVVAGIAVVEQKRADVLQLFLEVGFRRRLTAASNKPADGCTRMGDAPPIIERVVGVAAADVLESLAILGE